MKLTNLHHIAIIASDYECAKDFYVNKLGLSVIREEYRADKKDYKLDLKLDNCEIELFVKQNSPKRLSYPEACGLRHLAFQVEDLEKAIAELEENGIAVEEIRIDPCTGKKMTFFYDPDALPIEIREM